MKQALILSGDGYEVSLTKDAIKYRDSLIRNSGKVTSVEDKSDEALAIAEASALNAFIREVEHTRTAIKAPINELGRKIDRIAADAVADAKAEVSRVKGLIGVYQEKLAAEKRRIEEEARRKQQEAMAALAKAEAAKREAERKKTVLAETKAERLEDKAVEARVEVMALKQQAEATKVKGGRMEIDFEVEDIAAFYDEHPELCTVTIKTREVKEWLKRRAEREGIEAPQEPGLRVFLKPTIRL